jgi:hypothetical protein
LLFGGGDGGGAPSGIGVGSGELSCAVSAPFTRLRTSVLHHMMMPGYAA